LLYYTIYILTTLFFNMKRKIERKVSKSVYVIPRYVHTAKMYTGQSKEEEGGPVK